MQRCARTDSGWPGSGMAVGQARLRGGFAHVRVASPIPAAGEARVQAQRIMRCGKPRGRGGGEVAALMSGPGAAGRGLPINGRKDHARGQPECARSAQAVGILARRCAKCGQGGSPPRVAAGGGLPGPARVARLPLVRLKGAGTVASSRGGPAQPGGVVAARGARAGGERQARGWRAWIRRWAWTRRSRSRFLAAGVRFLGPLPDFASPIESHTGPIC